MDILALLGHVNLLPVIYGLVIAFGLLIEVWKLLTGRIVSLIIDCGVWYLIFSLHGGTMTGGLAASIAAPLVALGLPLITFMVFRR